MRFKLHEGISIDMVIALFASHFSNLRERAAMNGTKVPQEESLISATEYKERSKEALSRIARSMSDNIAAQAIALVCSLALLLGKISLGYFAIDRSAPLRKATAFRPSPFPERYRMPYRISGFHPYYPLFPVEGDLLRFS